MIWHFMEVWGVLLVAFAAGGLLGTLIYMGVAVSPLAGVQVALADAIGERLAGLWPNWRREPEVPAFQTYRPFPEEPDFGPLPAPDEAGADDEIDPYDDEYWAGDDDAADEDFGGTGDEGLDPDGPDPYEEEIPDPYVEPDDAFDDHLASAPDRAEDAAAAAMPPGDGGDPLGADQAGPDAAAGGDPEPTPEIAGLPRTPALPIGAGGYSDLDHLGLAEAFDDDVDEPGADAGPAAREPDHRGEPRGTEENGGAGVTAEPGPLTAEPTVAAAESDPDDGLPSAHVEEAEAEVEAAAAAVPTRAEEEEPAVPVAENLADPEPIVLAAQGETGSAAAPAVAAGEPEAAPVPEESSAAAMEPPVAGPSAGRPPAMRPLTLPGPRNGVPDNLQRIRGIGQKNEALLNGLGIYHFGQIAAWTPAEARWVAGHLAFPDRLERDDWIGQAIILATGGAPAQASGPGRRKGEGEDTPVAA